MWGWSGIKTFLEIVINTVKIHNDESMSSRKMDIWHRELICSEV